MAMVDIQANCCTPNTSENLSSLDTPLGDRDPKPKVQVCLDYRNKEIAKSKSKKTQKVLEVTVMWVKHLPKTKDNKRPSPFVKLRLHPGDIIYTTELKTEKIDAQYIETFEFHIQDSLKGMFLLIDVCDRKATRNAKCFGTVRISLDQIQLNKPDCQWFKLDVSALPDDNKENAKAIKKKKTDNNKLQYNSTPIKG